MDFIQTLQIDPDLALVLGILIGGFSIPGILSALSDGRAPRAPMLTVLLSAGMIYYAVANKPGGYEMTDIPDAFIDVIARIFY